MRKLEYTDDEIGNLELELTNRADGKPRLKTVLDFDRGDAWDVITAITKCKPDDKTTLTKLIKK